MENERSAKVSGLNKSCWFLGMAVDEENARLAVGSVIAAEMRQAIFSTLGLTGCAGIANNKLLAKLVSGTFKPNQQTTLLPYSTAELMSSLTGLIKVPGKMTHNCTLYCLYSVNIVCVYRDWLQDTWEVKGFGSGQCERSTVISSAWPGEGVRWSDC